METVSRVAISRTEERLTLTLPQGDRLFTTGCPLFLLALVCLTVLGLLALVFEAQYGAQRGLGGAGPGGDADLIAPGRNHLGFLWLLALLLMVAFLPLYVIRAGRARIVYAFDRPADAFTRNDRRIAALRRVEQVRVRALNDPDGALVHRLFVVYGDGREIFLDQSYGEPEIWILAHEIADFVGVGVA